MLLTLFCVAGLFALSKSSNARTLQLLAGRLAGRRAKNDVGVVFLSPNFSDSFPRSRRILHTAKDLVFTFE